MFHYVMMLSAALIRELLKRAGTSEHFLWELLPVVAPRLSMRGWSAALVTAGLGVALAVATLAKLIDDNEFQTHWAWIGFGLSLAIMLTAILRVRFRWRTREHDELEAERSATADAPSR